ncbi:MAG: hypothetical protein GX763_04500 [Clostridiaceae bacterium]|nr:hypothetical protein [Clostridiaceae bacterium]
MKLKQSELGKFWRLFGEAARENLPVGCDKATKDAFRRKLIKDSTGKESLTQVNRGLEYEKLMEATADMTENWEAKLYWGTAQERKFLHLIGVCVVQIGQLAKEPHAWHYVKGTLHQAHWPEDWQDISHDMLHTVFKMLDTHRRRLLHRAGWQGSKWDQPFGFHPNRTYFYNHQDRLLYRDDIPVKPAKPDHISCSLLGDMK